ncbi:oxidoreductase [Streptomyces camponoticapitis]|uniref:Oxidoreductase n=1 Tax=Streptomyces camponoticapitis TaxID=1616125 RepID=A0ABQ2E3I1_9ACTN|nr:FAD-binding oxidoreductase [Streptomyces camponoticapitis]GGJ92929.1 oxidoreductase [Streptomyces camponoticapitis]
MPAEIADPVTGWGRTAPTAAARLVRPRSYEEAVRAVRDCGTRGGIPRGLGRAYGDAAQNAGGSLIDMTALDRVLSVDAGAGIVECEAGISLHRLMEVLLPLGWFVPVTPGTRHVTVGGAIGSDIHGRNHRASGSFSRHVLSLDLLTADGDVRTVVPGTPLFDATAGGMGLTGVILSATFRLHPVETSLMSVDTERATDLDDLMDRLTTSGRRHRYSVAWIDLLAGGSSLGRSVLTHGEHTTLDTLSAHAARGRGGLGGWGGWGGWGEWGSRGAAARARRQPLAFRPGQLPAAPSYVAQGLLGRTTVGLFNELWYRGAGRRRTGELQRISAFFHPLDGVPHWNRLYGRGGFVRYQFAVGHGQEEALVRIVRRIVRRGFPAPLAVLKRFGAGDPGWLSFPMAGWTLSLDMPTDRTGLGPFLDELDEDVAAAGGRVCLAKDSRLRPELLAAMYPRLDEFRALRAELDPRAVFVSDLSRRLSI